MYMCIDLLLVTSELTLFSHCRGCIEAPVIPRSRLEDLLAAGEIEGGEEGKRREERRERERKGRKGKREERKRRREEEEGRQGGESEGGHMVNSCMQMRYQCGAL